MLHCSIGSRCLSTINPLPPTTCLTWLAFLGYSQRVSKIPSQKDINPYGDAKAAAAARHFEGKSREGVLDMFAEAGGIAPYLEDLYWMGPQAFDVYFEAVCDFYRYHLEHATISHRAEMVKDLLKLAQERYNIHATSLLSKSPAILALLEDARPLLEADAQSLDDAILRQYDRTDEALRAELAATQAATSSALSALDDYSRNGPQMRGLIWQKCIYDSYVRGKSGMVFSYQAFLVLLVLSFAAAELPDLPSYVPLIARCLLLPLALLFVYFFFVFRSVRCPHCECGRLRKDFDESSSDNHVYFTCRSCACSVRSDMQPSMPRGSYTKDQHFDANC